MDRELEQIVLKKYFHGLSNSDVALAHYRLLNSTYEIEPVSKPVKKVRRPKKDKFWGNCKKCGQKRQLKYLFLDLCSTCRKSEGKPDSFAVAFAKIEYDKILNKKEK